jgi:hypothetical protein
MLLSITLTSAPKSFVSLLSSDILSAREEADSWLISTRSPPVFVSKEESCLATEIPESMEGVPGDLQKSNYTKLVI